MKLYSRVTHENSEHTILDSPDSRDDEVNEQHSQLIQTPFRILVTEYGSISSSMAGLGGIIGLPRSRVLLVLENRHQYFPLIILIRQSTYKIRKSDLQILLQQQKIGPYEPELIWLLTYN